MIGAEQLVQGERLKGERAMLTKQLHWRFEEVPAHVIERIERANPAELERWAERLIKNDTLEQIFS